MIQIRGLERLSLIDYPGKIAATVFFSGCNFRCGYCHNPELVEPDLIKKNFIKAQYADYKQIIQDAINNKAKAEYRGGFFSKSDFESMKKDTEKFLKMAGEVFN